MDGAEQIDMNIIIYGVVGHIHQCLPVQHACGIDHIVYLPFLFCHLLQGIPHSGTIGNVYVTCLSRKDVYTNAQTL